MKRLLKKPVVLVLLLVSSVLIGIGGKTYMDLREEKKVQELLLAEKESVQELKKKFVSIAEVKIEKTGYHNMTGSYRMFVTMTNTNGQSASFSYSFGKTSREIGSYGIEARSVQVEGTTTTKVKVIHSNGKEDYV